MVDGQSASQPASQPVSQSASQSVSHSVLVSQPFWAHVKAVPIKVDSNVISVTQGQPENRENPHRKFLLTLSSTFVSTKQEKPQNKH
jgi:hypothetical protein